MSSSKHCGGDETPLWGGSNEIIARVGRLIETPRPADGYPLEWAVEAFFLGDATAIATLSLRRSG